MNLFLTALAAADPDARSWVGPVIGGGLLALAGWTLWRGARVRRDYSDREGHADDGPDEDLR